MLILKPSCIKWLLRSRQKAEAVAELDVQENHFGREHFSAVLDVFLGVALSALD